MNFGNLNDDYLRALTEPAQEPQVITQCAYCTEDLYEGESLVGDGCKVYCNWECARNGHGIKEIEIQEEGELCSICERELTPEYEAYTNNCEEHFCTIECAENVAGLRTEVFLGGYR